MSDAPLKYVKRPIVVEAMERTADNLGDLMDWISEEGGLFRYYANLDTLYIQTLEGGMCCSIGDYVIKGVEGEFYPCKPTIFHMSYTRNFD